MARIVGGNPDAEIDLTEAYEKLSEAAVAMGSADPKREQTRASSEPQADALDVIAALAVDRGDCTGDSKHPGPAGCARYRSSPTHPPAVAVTLSIPPSK
jgi:hypothetical protein